MSEAEDIPVAADAETMTKLVTAFEGDTPGGDLVAYAKSLDVAPPDERDGWDIIYVWGPNGEDLGLHWYQAADDPLALVDQ